MKNYPACKELTVDDQLQKQIEVFILYEGWSESSRKVLLNCIAFIDCKENSQI